MRLEEQLPRYGMTGQIANGLESCTAYVRDQVNVYLSTYDGRVMIGAYDCDPVPRGSSNNLICLSASVEFENPPLFSMARRLSAEKYRSKTKLRTALMGNPKGRPERETVRPLVSFLFNQPRLNEYWGLYASVSTGCCIPSSRAMTSFCVRTIIDSLNSSPVVSTILSLLERGKNVGLEARTWYARNASVPVLNWTWKDLYGRGARGRDSGGGVTAEGISPGVIYI